MAINLSAVVHVLTTACAVVILDLRMRVHAQHRACDQEQEAQARVLAALEHPRLRSL